jgi:hypothetical protein
MERYTNNDLGISVLIPDGWEALPATWAKTARLKSAPTSAELAEMLSKAQAPFLYLQQPHSDPLLAIPCAQFLAKPANTLSDIGGMGKLIDVTCDQLSKAFPDYSCLSRHDQMIVSGLKCGYLKSSMSVINDQCVTFHCASELFLIESSRALFVVGMSASIEEEHYPTEIFRNILRNLQFL